MKVAVIGNGIMGTGIVESIVSNAIINGKVDQVIWIARNQERATESNKKILRLIRKRIKTIQDDKLCPEEIINKILHSKRYDVISQCDLIIEAVSENEIDKRSVLSIISQHANPRAIIATNTSAMSVSRLSENVTHPERFLGTHFFNPVSLMELVEVVKGSHTSKDSINKTCDFLSKLNKEPIIVKDSPGFIVNRLLIPMINEAISLYAEGIAEPQEIDKAMKLGSNMPIGPLALSDLIGNDIVKSILESFYHAVKKEHLKPHPLLLKLVDKNKLGRKTKEGFYKY